MIERLKIAWYSRQLKHIPSLYHDYLTKYNDYYSNLNPHLQRVFRERLFISSKFINFKPVHFDEVTPKMKILITSALVQITFGLSKYILRRFTKVLVVPSTYRFREYNALLGHVDYDHNLIVMSWPSVKEGFTVPDDAMNVALHELAHALQRENLDDLFFERFFNSVKMNAFNREGFKELYKIRARRNEYLREYAGQNMLELFAVCMECFFEQPEIFKNEVPKLYILMSDLLEQDPSNQRNPLMKKG